MHACHVDAAPGFKKVAERGGGEPGTFFRPQIVGSISRHGIL